MPQKHFKKSFTDLDYVEMLFLAVSVLYFDFKILK
jgi:hypothetical protein